MIVTAHAPAFKLLACNIITATLIDAPLLVYQAVSSDGYGCLAARSPAPLLLLLTFFLLLSFLLLLLSRPLIELPSSLPPMLAIWSVRCLKGLKNAS